MILNSININKLVGPKPRFQRRKYVKKLKRSKYPEFTTISDENSMNLNENAPSATYEDINDSFLNDVRDPKRDELLKAAIENPLLVTKELCKRDFTEFIKYFWDTVSSDELFWNWHIDAASEKLMEMAQGVAKHQPKKYDLIYNVPPGMTKSITCSVMFPVWCWINWPWMRFICASYSAQLALEQADLSRELVRSAKFQQLFPEIRIKDDKDTKSNYRIQYIDPKTHLWRNGGNRYSTSVGGTLTGFHGHVLIVDDPLNPKEAVSENKINTANHWMSQTLSTRKTDKAVTVTILVMQRLHEDDPTGNMLAKHKQKIFHICLPGELGEYAKFVRPIEWIKKYDKNGLLDAKRLPRAVLDESLVDLGQYGYAGQIGQHPVPPGEGMFKVDMFSIVDTLPHRTQTLRYWDKAGTKDAGAYTCGVKMSRMTNGKFIIEDVKRGQWAAYIREQIMRSTAEADGKDVIVWHEQEPGSGGKDSAMGTTLNLAGFSVYVERPTGDKIYRADPYAVQVSAGNVLLLRGEWNKAFINEHRMFPYGRYKDQVDAAGGAFNKLAQKRMVRRLY